MKNKLFLTFTFSLLGVLLAGCSPHTNLVFGDSSSFPQTPKEYHASLIKGNMLENEKIIPVSFNTVKKRMRTASKKCYTFNARHYRGGAEKYSQTFKGKATTVGKSKILFSMQVKGLRGSNTVFADGKGKEPKDGLFLYGVEFTGLSKNKTRVKSFAPWGWGNAADTVVEVAEGKFGAKCPPKSDRFPGAK